MTENEMMRTPQIPDAPGAESITLRPDGTALRIKETETHYIEVVPMFFNDRIVTTPKNLPLTYDRYWCFRRGPAAVLAALAWDGATDTEPVGWIKSWDQRYSEEFLRDQPS